MRVTGEREMRTWSDGVHTITSPVNARALGFSVQSVITDVRASGTGTKLVPIVRGALRERERGGGVEHDALG